jgi:hypothetical protein
LEFVQVPDLLEIPELLPLVLPEAPTNVHEAVPSALGPVVHRGTLGASKL